MRPFGELRAASGFHLVGAEATWSHAEADAVAAGWARALGEAGTAPHEPVALIAPTSASSIMMLLALRRARATVVLVHPRLAPAEAQDQVRRAGARLALHAAGLEAHAPDAVSAAPLPAPGGPLRVPPLSGTTPVRPGNYILFTSGSEGRPKGVLLGDGGMRVHAEAVRQRLPAASEERWLATLPLAHVGGLAALLRAAFKGTGIVLPPEPLAEGLSAAIRAQRVTHVPLVPTILRRWLSVPGGVGHLPSLRCVLVGGAATDPDLHERAAAAGLPVRATYGLTEAGSQVATATDGTPVGSVGPPLPGVEVRTGEGGRIEVKTPARFIGYVDEGPSALGADGWIRTGDVGRIDEHGDLWVAGRATDMIVTGGENVDPAEVEAAVAAHPAVLEAAVVGRPDREWGEAVCAVVVLRQGTRLTIEELREHCARRLARFKCPRRLEVASSIPRTATGKPLRAALRAATSGPTGP